jgi:DNA-binding response OmpR family regulator
MMLTPMTRILFVDDSALALAHISAILEDGGYEVMVASSGETALAQIGRLHPDLVLLDVYLSGIDGFEVCRRLRAEPATASLPIVILSGAREKISGFRAGADDYLVKEDDLADLPGRLALVLRWRGLNRPSA